ncbi:unnamed protein product [Leptidea sinapis]|uniref:Uncharacterized protein n=1 Tax=Leptidea sinapis TaxID=189913 RepID=A0A5E4QTY5_9NEOP|nr:unnamed protein product [Leptidea sinapis]
MNKGFLMFSQNKGITSEWMLNRDSLVLKDEPEDLTHLAPTAGDAHILLENSPFDMFDDFILNDNYCSLLGDDLANGSPVDSLIGDSLLSSPERQENESTGEQSSLLTELSLDAFDSARSDNDIDDGNSPFIPTTDELPVLEPAVMWGALPDSVRQARPQPSEIQSSSPALQRLLVAPPTGPPPQDIITNIYSEQGLIPSRNISSWDTGVKRIMKQEEEPTAKRIKRSPTPTQTSTSSSVLMNLLDIQQLTSQQAAGKTLQHQVLQNTQNAARRLPMSKSMPIPVINIVEAALNKQNARANTASGAQMIRWPSNPMSPLSLNISSPMWYSLPTSPNYSSSLSPAQKNRVQSPYATPQSLSPASTYSQYSPSNKLSPNPALQGYDPYLCNKMQPSPTFSIHSNEMLLDSNMPLTTSDLWPESEMIQNTSDLLTAFDDVKLV